MVVENENAVDIRKLRFVIQQRTNEVEKRSYDNDNGIIEKRQ